MEQRELDRITDNEVDALKTSQQIQSRITYARRDRRDRFITGAALAGFACVVLGLLAIILRAAL
jgi:hypothetical protein